jgi:hypothetical protein
MKPGRFWSPLSQSQSGDHAFLILDREPRPALIEADTAAAEAAGGT